MELIMLGTGNAMAQNCYNTCFVLKNENEYFMVDAGGGNKIFTQLDKADIPYNGIRNLFVTHAHTDHILGVIWMIRKIGALMHKGKYEGHFHIYCHELVAEALNTICAMTLPPKFVKELGTRIFIHIVKDADTTEANGMKLTFFDIASTKAKQFGFQAILPDGRTLVCLGDEPYNPICARYVEHPDWMLCEAFCLYDDRDIFHPYEKHHSTALDAGRLAEELGVKNLLLYHTEDKSLSTRKEKYTAEARQVFSGNVFVPEDLEHLEL